VKFREIADIILAASTGSETEVVYLRQDENLTRFANNHIHQNVTETNFQVAIRCAIGQRVGTAVSNNIHPDSLRSLAQRARDLAVLQPENPDFKGLPGPAELRDAPGFDEAAASCSPTARAGGVAIACRKATAAGYTAAGSMTTTTHGLAVANSKGVFAERTATVVDATTVMIGGDSSGWAQASGWKLDSVNWENLADEAIQKVRMGATRAECEPGEYTVVLDPYATADILEMLAFDGMGALAYQEQRSWLNGRLGQKIMSDNVTIVDDGLDRSGIPMPFDFEGQPKRVTPIVENGTCKNVVYDSYAAGRQGVASTGHATPPSPTDKYGPLPMNLFLRPGTSTVDQMISSTSRGLYITRFWYTRTVHPRDMVVTGMTRDGTFVIRDGEIIGATKSMRFTQSYVEALAKVSAIGVRPRILRSGFGTTTVPEIKLDQFRFTSATK